MAILRATRRRRRPSTRTGGRAARRRNQTVHTRGRPIRPHRWMGPHASSFPSRARGLGRRRRPRGTRRRRTTTLKTTSTGGTRTRATGRTYRAAGLVEVDRVGCDGAAAGLLHGEYAHRRRGGGRACGEAGDELFAAGAGVGGACACGGAGGAGDTAAAARHARAEAEGARAQCAAGGAATVSNSLHPNSQTNMRAGTNTRTMVPASTVYSDYSYYPYSSAAPSPVDGVFPQQSGPPSPALSKTETEAEWAADASRLPTAWDPASRGKQAARVCTVF